jgi:hypothetical protein
VIICFSKANNVLLFPYINHLLAVSLARLLACSARLLALLASLLACLLAHFVDAII